MSEKSYAVDGAISVIAGAAAKFDESIDLAITLSGDSVSGQCQLEHPYGGDRIIVFCSDVGGLPHLQKNRDRLLIGGEGLVDDIRNKKSLVKGFKYAVSTPILMPKVGSIAKILGPRGLMPNPKLGLVSADVESLIKEIDSGRIILKSRDGVAHVKFGKKSFTAEQLSENFHCVINSVRALAPKDVNFAAFVKKIVMSSTMGPGYSIDIGSLNA